MTWHTTTTEKPANSVDVLGWTGEKYVVAQYLSNGPYGEYWTWLVEDSDGDPTIHHADFITHWTPLPTAPASAPVSPQTPAQE
jgi:hypothetical protein